MKIGYIGMPIAFGLMIGSIWFRPLFELGIIIGIASLGLSLTFGMAKIESTSNKKGSPSIKRGFNQPE